jgi:lysophospholipase L1-like esterase
LNTQLTQIANGNAEANTVLLLQCGTNSLTAPGYVSVWGTIEGMLDDAVAAGIKVQPATITPTGGQSTEDDFNALLLAWCASNNIECADTYTVLDDATSPGALAAAYDSGDDLHPNAAGNAAMAAEWHRAGVVNGYW